MAVLVKQPKPPEDPGIIDETRFGSLLKAIDLIQTVYGFSQAFSSFMPKTGAGLTGPGTMSDYGMGAPAGQNVAGTAVDRKLLQVRRA